MSKHTRAISLTLDWRQCKLILDGLHLYELECLSEYENEQDDEIRAVKERYYDVTVDRTAKIEALMMLQGYES